MLPFVILDYQTVDTYLITNKHLNILFKKADMIYKYIAFEVLILFTYWKHLSFTRLEKLRLLLSILKYYLKR